MLKEILNYTLFEGTSFEFEVIRILYFLAIIAFIKFFVFFLIKRVLPPIYRRSGSDVGAQFATNQILTYIIYTVGLLAAIQSLGINLNVIWGAMAALMVGFGLGIQQTINDLVSGIILLFERSIEVGDVVEVDGVLGYVTKISIRTSKVETFDHIMLIIPNSKMVGNQIKNWSHNHDRVRFSVGVGVAYGSDTSLVKRLLLESVEKHEKVLKEPLPFVRFTNFGDSSLDFEVYYWTYDFINHRDIKSDLRFTIDQAFRENGLEIPFPQRDVWFKNAK